MRVEVLAFALSFVLGICGISLAHSNEPGLVNQTEPIVAAAGNETDSWVEEKTGQYLPMDTEFINEEGKHVRLRDIIDRPTILLPIYFYCPNACSKNLANLAIALHNLSVSPGKDYRVIALSFNDDEGYLDAARAKKNYLKLLDDNFPADAWRFLTGKQDAIKAVTDAVGFRFKKVNDLTFIHPAALMTVDKDGKIIRYVYGSFLAGDIDMGLSAASTGSPALSVKRLLDFCFNYDPDKNSSVFQRVKIGVMLFFTIALIFVYIYFRTKRPRKQNDL